jgi:hypothetical protein
VSSCEGWGEGWRESEREGRKDVRRGCGLVLVLVLVFRADEEEDELVLVLVLAEEQGGRGKGDAERDVGSGIRSGSVSISVSISMFASLLVLVLVSSSGVGEGEGGDTETDAVLSSEVNDDMDEFTDRGLSRNFNLTLSPVLALLVLCSFWSWSAFPNFSVTFFFFVTSTCCTCAGGGGVSCTCGKPACGPRKLRIEEKCSQSWYATYMVSAVVGDVGNSSSGWWCFDLRGRGEVGEEEEEEGNAAHSIMYTRPGCMTFTFRFTRCAKADNSM